MTYDEMIAVIQAAKAGKVIEYFSTVGHWCRWLGTSFNFKDVEYRVKPEPRRCWVKFTSDGRVQNVSGGPHEGYAEMVEVVR